MLCDLAYNFPPYAAMLLERDRHLKRNFREETVTDLLMAGLVGLEKFGIRVDFPDEPTTGGDMDWIFAAPLELGGGRYLRLLLQAKRAQFAKLKGGGYWYYKHLDHGVLKGQQAQVLVNYAASSPDGMKTCPLYSRPLTSGVEGDWGWEGAAKDDQDEAQDFSEPGEDAAEVVADG